MFWVLASGFRAFSNTLLPISGAALATFTTRLVPPSGSVVAWTLILVTALALVSAAAQDVAQPILGTTAFPVALLDARFNIQAGLHVIHELVYRKLGEPSDLVAEAFAKPRFRCLEKELSKRLPRQCFCLTVEHLRHLELEEACVRATTAAPVAVTALPLSAFVATVFFAPSAAALITS